MKYTKILCLLLALLLLAGCGSNAKQEAPDVLPEVLDNLTQNLAVLAQGQQLYQEGLAACDAYIDGKLTYAELNDTLRTLRFSTEDLAVVPCSDELKNATLTDQKLGESLVAAESIQIELMSYPHDLDFLSGQLYNSQDYLPPEQMHDLVELFRENNRNTVEIVWLELNDYLIGCSGDPRIDTFCQQMQDIPCYAALAQNWTADEQKLSAQIELRWSTVEENLQKMNLMVGDSQLDLDYLTEDMEAGMDALVQWVMEECNVDEEVALKLIELKMKKDELAAAKEQLREKFAPSVSNTSIVLFGKAAKFAGVKMYDDALACIDVFFEKTDDEIPEICGHAVRAMYTTAPETGLCYGMLIVENENPEVDVQPGDILIAADDVILYEGDDYAECADLRQNGYVLTLLRLNADNQLENIQVPIPKDTSFPITILNVCEIHR